MSEQDVDPRVRRTRQLLSKSLAKLLETKEFNDISIQDIADVATVNRATFYDHYPDKFALLQSMVEERFHQLLAQRGINFDAGCSSALKAIVLGVCDYLAEILSTAAGKPRRIEPPMESAVIEIVRRMFLDGLKKHPSADSASRETIAAAVSWAIYGAAREWIQTPDRVSSEKMADTIVTLVSPMLSAVL